MSAPQRPLAVVTGASSGIGYELARCFAADDWDVCVVAEDLGLTDAAARLQTEHPAVTVHAHRADLATADGVEGLVSELVASGEEPRLAALALNAGIGVGGRFVDTDLTDEMRIIALNIQSTVHLAKRLLPGMVQRENGKVLVTSSVDAQMSDPYEAVYGASKAFVKTFGESLAAEVAPAGVTVTVFMPGPTQTNFFARAGMLDTRAGTMKKDPPETVARQAYDALQHGRTSVTAGSVLTHASNLANKYLPAPVKGAMHKVLSKPGTGSGSGGATSDGSAAPDTAGASSDGTSVAANSGTTGSGPTGSGPATTGS